MMDEEKLRWHLKFINHFWENKQTKQKPEQTPLGLVLFVGVFLLSLFLFQYFAERALKELNLCERITPLEHTLVFLFLLRPYLLLLQLLTFSMVLVIFCHSQVLCVAYYLSQPYSERVEF